MTTTSPDGFIVSDGFYEVEAIWNDRKKKVTTNNMLCPSCLARLVLTHDVWGELSDCAYYDGLECDLCGAVAVD